jgi:hypothetical protein
VVGDHVGAPGLEDLDELAELVVVELVAQCAERDQVGESDRRFGARLVLVGGERLDPGDRGGEVPAPGVDEQPVERPAR